MLNYNEIVTQSEGHRDLLLATAAQQRLAQPPTAQPHPILAWIGRRLIRWGQQLQGEPTPPSLPLLQRQ